MTNTAPLGRRSVGRLFVRRRRSSSTYIIPKFRPPSPSPPPGGPNRRPGRRRGSPRVPRGSAGIICRRSDGEAGGGGAGVVGRGGVATGTPTTGNDIATTSKTTTTTMTTAKTTTDRSVGRDAAHGNRGGPAGGGEGAPTERGSGQPRALYDRARIRHPREISLYGRRGSPSVPRGSASIICRRSGGGC